MSKQIAIDGPAGAGKSTIAKEVASRLGFIYVDTGAMYRAMGLHFLAAGIDLDDEAEINASVETAEVSLQLIDGTQHVLLNGKDVTKEVRSEEAGMTASKTSKYSLVRSKLSDTQRTIAEQYDVVMDGRDIGTAVLPHAKCKIYLTAGSARRAERRYKELIKKGQEADLATIEADIIQRDEQDMTREISPLCQAEDAVLVDSSDMGIEEVVQTILALAKERF